MDLARSASDSLSIGIGFLFGLRQLRTGAVPEVERAEPCGAMNGMEPFIGSRLGGAMDDGLVRNRCLERLGRRGGEGGGGINQGYLGSSRHEPRLSWGRRTSTQAGWFGVDQNSLATSGDTVRQQARKGLYVEARGEEGDRGSGRSEERA